MSWRSRFPSRKRRPRRLPLEESKQWYRETMTDADDPTVGLDLFIDPKRPSVHANCPFCEGVYVAGYSTKPIPPRPGSPDGTKPSEGGALVLHTSPPCAKFSVLLPVAFLREARLAGAERKRVG